MKHSLTFLFILLSTKSYAGFTHQIVKFISNPTNVSSAGLSELLSFLTTISGIGFLIGGALMILSGGATSKGDKSTMYIKGGQITLYSAVAMIVFGFLLGFTN